jgi:hypothetical protein
MRDNMPEEIEFVVDMDDAEVMDEDYGNIPFRMKYHRLDGWRGYTYPARAVAGVSDCGMCEDSPAPSIAVLTELADLRKHLLDKGIECRHIISRSSNVFMIKHWLIPTNPNQQRRARRLANEWLKVNDSNTRYIHDAS